MFKRSMPAVFRVYFTLGALFLVLSITLAACGTGAAPMAPPSNTGSSGVSPVSERPSDQERGDESRRAESERLVIKTATLRLVVENPAEKNNAISRLADEAGGWVVDSNVSKSTTYDGRQIVQATITIRVPAEKLNDVLGKIKAGVISVEDDKVSGQDVTAAYIDTKSKLTNLEATEVQLRKIMDAAKTTEETLSVYRELSRVRGEIEVAKGQIQFYEQSAAFSSITVNLSSKPGERRPETLAWNPLETVRNAFDTLVGVVKSVLDSVIWLAILVGPFALVFGLPTLLVLRRARRQTPAQAPEPPQTPEGS